MGQDLSRACARLATSGVDGASPYVLTDLKTCLDAAGRDVRLLEMTLRPPFRALVAVDGREVELVEREGGCCTVCFRAHPERILYVHAQCTTTVPAVAHAAALGQVDWWREWPTRDDTFDTYVKRHGAPAAPKKSTDDAVLTFWSETSVAAAIQTLFASHS